MYRLATKYSEKNESLKALYSLKKCN